MQDTAHTANQSCPGNSVDCHSHFHDEDARYLPPQGAMPADGDLEHSATNTITNSTMPEERSQHAPKPSKDDAQMTCEEGLGFRGIIRNFTPSWFIITMSTGVLAILFRKIPYPTVWLGFVSDVFFALNLMLFLLFTVITILRYILYPHLIKAVLHHPHQSLFIATFPVGLATLVNLSVLNCLPAWGQGFANFCWSLWWIVSILATASCFHLTWVIMTNRRRELEELTALYLIPIVAIVIAATSGATVATSLADKSHQMWTIIISYIFWGIGTPLSWIILTLYFLRMTVHKPLEREVIVTVLVPIGPLGLSGFSLIALGKLARQNFPVTGVIPSSASAGDFFYLIGLVGGLLLWGFAVIWFIIAVIMIATAYPFPFNMGWWGFIFPIGVFTLLTIAIGDEFEFVFFKVLSCILTGICFVMWLYLAARTVARAISGKMFFGPCLGTDLFLKRTKAQISKV